MSAVLSKGNLFDPELVTDLINKVKGKSALAIMSASEPMPFNGLKEFTFSMDSEIDIVAENAPKSHGGISLAPRTIVPFKVEYGARVSDEFMIAAEEMQISILKSFNDGFAKKVAKGLDLMAFHGINPRTGLASTVIGSNHFGAAVTQFVTYTSSDPDANIESAVRAIEGSDGEVSGAILSSIFRAALADYKVNGIKQYPELSWGGNPGAINGLKVETTKNVSHTGNNRAIVGDFSGAFRWGYAKEIPLEVIQYGDPDNTGKDLKGHNQVYLRSELYLGWGILDPESFVRIVVPTEVSISSATANGSSGSTTSTKITITFNKTVYGLKTEHITLAAGTGNGAGAATAGALTGSGTTYELALESVTTQGNVSLTIADIGGFDFPATATTVAVYKKST